MKKTVDNSTEMATVVETQLNSEVAAKKTAAEAAKAEAKELLAKAKAAAEAAKQAAKEAKDAAKQAKAFSSRPVRTSFFRALRGTEEIAKSDVHYVAEKAAIDEITRMRAEGESVTLEPITVEKANKETNEAKVISCISLDPSTLQIVID